MCLAPLRSAFIFHCVMGNCATRSNTERESIGVMSSFKLRSLEQFQLPPPADSLQPDPFGPSKKCMGPSTATWKELAPRLVQLPVVWHHTKEPGSLAIADLPAAKLKSPLAVLPRPPAT